jgi:hypothetical protein
MIFGQLATGGRNINDHSVVQMPHADISTFVDISTRCSLRNQSDRRHSSDLKRLRILIRLV